MDSSFQGDLNLEFTEFTLVFEKLAEKIQKEMDKRVFLQKIEFHYDITLWVGK